MLRTVMFSLKPLAPGTRQQIPRIVAHPGATAGVFAVFALGSVALFPLVGRDFFPTVDAGLVKLHVRGPMGAADLTTSKWIVTGDGQVR